MKKKKVESQVMFKTKNFKLFVYVDIHVWLKWALKSFLLLLTNLRKIIKPEINCV